MTSKELKAEQLIKQDRIFLITSTDKHDYYIVKGLLGAVYNIIYDKQNDSYNCDCKNVRPIDCYHVAGVRKMRNQNDAG